MTRITQIHQGAWASLPHRPNPVGGASGSESLRIGETPTLLEALDASSSPSAPAPASDFFIHQPAAANFLPLAREARASAPEGGRAPRDLRGSAAGSADVPVGTENFINHREHSEHRGLT
jgi:hypothetical protein